jgi:hypothetical protein
MCVEAHDPAPADALGSVDRRQRMDLEENRLHVAGINYARRGEMGRSAGMLEVRGIRV